MRQFSTGQYCSPVGFNASVPGLMQVGKHLSAEVFIQLMVAVTERLGLWGENYDTEATLK